MNADFKNPNVLPEGSAEARAFRAQRAAQQPGVTTPAPGPTPAPTAPAAPNAPAGGFAARARGAMPQNLGRVGLAAAALGAAPEILDTAKVAQDKNSTGMDVATQAAEGAGRWGATTAGAVMGAKGGAALGAMTGPFAPVAIPVGGALGGLAGAALGSWGADKAIRSGRELSGVDAASPVDRLAGQSPSAPENASAGVTATPPEQLVKQLGGLDRHHAQNVQLQAAARTPEQARAEAAEQPTGQQVPGLSGVYKHGEGQYSDNPNGLGLPQNLGQPSAQNMAAADALAGQEQKRSMMSVMREQQEQQQQAAAQPSFQMPRQESAYEREARMRERNSIMSLLQQPMTGDPRRDLTASQRQQMVAMLGQEGQERQSSERNLVDFARQQMSDQTQRYTADTHAGVGQQRNLVDAARLSMDQQTQGFANRAAQRRENILLRYDNAKTAQERAQIQQEHAEVFGKSEVDPYLVVPGGQQLNENGQAYTAPSAVFNRRTGEWLRQPGVGQQLPPNMSRQVGTSGGKPVYEDANGKRFIAG